MKLKYVGAKPIVSARGVSFDQTKPDSYTFLTAAIEFLEAIDSRKDEETTIDITGAKTKEYNSRELFDMLQKYCTNLEKIFDSREEKTEALIEKNLSNIRDKKDLKAIDREAWIANVKVMRDYYMQYITNESAYNCALHLLADNLHAAHTEEIRFPIGRNHGLMLSHLVNILRDHIPPYDATMTIEQDGDQAIGNLNMNRHPSNI